MAIKGFTFNGVHSDAFFIVNKIRRNMLPTLTHKTVKVPGQIGEHDVGIDIGMRQFDIDVTLIENSTEDLYGTLERLTEWLVNSELQDFVDDNHPDRTYKARLVGAASLERLASYGEGTISIVAPNPLANGKYREGKFTAGNYSTIRVTNYGNYAAAPRITVKFIKESPDFKINLKHTGEYVRVVNNFKVGDVLVIDNVTKKVTINGYVEMNRLDLLSDFFTLARGTNDLNVTDATLADITVSQYDRIL